MADLTVNHLGDQQHAPMGRAILNGAQCLCGDEIRADDLVAANFDTTRVHTGGGLYLLLILHYVEQECLAESSAAARPRNETIEQVCAYLAANYRQKFSLTEVAARFYLSPYYLSRLFRRVTGQSIVDYLNNRRIEAAQKLLETTELSISAIAEQTGFASAAHFRRVFREVTDISPLQYRKKQKK